MSNQIPPISNPSSLLHAKDLETGYHSGARKIVVSAGLPELVISPGRMICLLGANGAGKTTLLRTLAGLQPALGGTVAIDGVSHLPPAELARKISLVLTEKVVGTNLDVYSLVALGRYPWSGWLGGLDQAGRSAIERAMDAAGIRDLQRRKVHTLSDGESQKVMLARALAQDTPLLMLDEPTAHLDLPSRIRLMRRLHTLTREMNKGILLSTHELDLALQVADELWLLRRDGVLQKGTPEDLVLQGVFEAAFAGEDALFDRATGVFRMYPEGGPLLKLEGEGTTAFWTRRALQREGYTVDTYTAAAGDRAAADRVESAEPVVRIVEEKNAVRWIVETAGFSRSYPSIATLLHGLKLPSSLEK
jgi:iron complex transport system ATP-binding protein